MAWVLVQRAAWPVSCQAMSMLPARRAVGGAGGGPSQDDGLPGGSGGSACQAAAGPLTVTPRLPFSTTATVPSAPNQADTACDPVSPKGCDSCQFRPSPVQAAIRLADAPARAWSSATSRPPAWLSRMTCTGWPLRAAGAP